MEKMGRKGKSADKRPAKNRYWVRRTLESNKVKNLMKHCGMSAKQAVRFWNKSRQGRVPASFLRKGIV